MNRKVRLTATRYWLAGVCKFCFLIATLFLSAPDIGYSNASEAGVYVNETSRSFFKIKIEGEISAREVTTMKKALVAGLESGRVISVTLADSPGGDIRAAMEVGRMVRSLDIQTWVDGRCDSSCALIYFAGTLRVLLNTLL